MAAAAAVYLEKRDAFPFDIATSQTKTIEQIIWADFKYPIDRKKYSF